MFIDDPTSLTHPPERIKVPEEVIQYCDNFTVDAERTDLRYIDCLWYNMGYYGHLPEAPQLLPIFK